MHQILPRRAGVVRSGGWVTVRVRFQARAPLGESRVVVCSSPSRKCFSTTIRRDWARLGTIGHDLRRTKLDTMKGDFHGDRGSCLESSRNGKTKGLNRLDLLGAALWNISPDQVGGQSTVCGQACKKPLINESKNSPAIPLACAVDAHILPPHCLSRFFHRDEKKASQMC